MSSSLLRKSLDLFKPDLDQNGSKRGRESVTKSKQAADTNVKRGKKKNSHIANEKKMKKRFKKTLSKDGDKYARKDFTKDNLSYIEKLVELDQVAHSLNNSRTVATILNHQKGKLAKNRHEENCSKKDESTVFTEEDFDKFEASLT